MPALGNGMSRSFTLEIFEVLKGDGDGGDTRNFVSGVSISKWVKWIPCWRAVEWGNVRRTIHHCIKEISMCRLVDSKKENKDKGSKSRTEILQQMRTFIRLDRTLVCL